MKRLTALALAFAFLGTACDSDDHDHVFVGDFADTVVRWEFLRNVRNGAGDIVGTYLYDNAEVVHAGSGLCEESFVDLVEVSMPGFRKSFPCVFEGVQGATITGVPVGANRVTVTGWRADVNEPVYSTEMTIDVVPGGALDNDFYFSLDAVSAPIDIYAAIALGADQYYATCAAAGSPDIAFEVFDSFSSEPVLEGVVLCAPSTTPGYAIPVYVGDLDFDNYLIRMAGYTTSATIPAYDSCDRQFDHFGAQIGLDGVNFPLASGTCP